MSSTVNLRAVALRLLGATVVAGMLSAGSVSGVSAASSRTISVLVPVVADAGDGQYLTVDDIDSEVSDTGDWKLLTDLARRHGFTVALDARIPASITALGTDAPTAATDWLSDVMELDPIVLPWGNADVWTLGPVSTAALDAGQFARLSGSEASALVVWPTGDVIDETSIAVTAARGFGRMIVGDDVLAGGYDSAASGALADAVSPGSSTSIMAATAAVRAELDTSQTIVLPANPDELDALRAVSVLDQVVGSGYRVTRVIPVPVNAMRTPSRLAPAPKLVSTVLSAINADTELARKLTDDPEALVAPRVRTLAVLSRDVTESNFDENATKFLENTDWLSDLVGISLATEYTVLSNTAEVPVSVSNESDATVTLDVHVRSTSGIVQVETTSQTVTIAPRSNVRIMVAMTAVTNGRTSLVATLIDPDGGRIGKPVSFPIEVQAQWELLTVVLFAGGVSVIMTIGVMRTIRRRRGTA